MLRNFFNPFVGSNLFRPSYRDVFYFIPTSRIVFCSSDFREKIRSLACKPNSFGRLKSLKEDFGWVSSVNHSHFSNSSLWLDKFKFVKTRYLICFCCIDNGHIKVDCRNLMKCFFCG